MEKNNINILIACEFSGHTREEFIKQGFINTYSCDLLDSLIPSKNHIKGNVLDVLNNNWDLIIAHPPCRYLSYAGCWNWKNIIDIKEKQKEAIDFALSFIDKAKFVVIENPVSLLWEYLIVTQYISPHQFGEIYKKRTGFFLKNLPPLIETAKNVNAVPFQNYNSNIKNYRSITSKFLSEQIAIQWGRYILNYQLQLQF